MAIDATSTAMRLLDLLQALPSSGKRSATELRATLQQQGYSMTQRMVERDLCKLRERGLAYATSSGKPQGWARGSAALGLQLRDPNEALALEILASYSGHLLPPSVRAQLRERFQAARQTLGQHPNSDYARWHERVAVIPLSQPLIPPEVNPVVQRIVLQALLERRVLRVRYQARYAERAREREVHPAGLVARDGQYILVAFFGGNSQPYQLPLHRMHSAEMLAGNAQIPVEFDFQGYAHSGALGMGDGQWVRLTLVFDESAGRLFTESKLSPDQEVVIRELKRGAKRYHVTATLEDSPRLQAYLNSFGDSLISRRQRAIPAPASHKANPSIRPTRRRIPT